MISGAAYSQVSDKRIERLAGLAKVWGAVKFLHPYPAYRYLDWDKALVEAIPKVNESKSPDDYAAAINSMLKMLDDHQTTAFIENGAEKKSTIQPGVEPIRFEKGTLYVNAFAAAMQTSQSKSSLTAFNSKFFALFEQAKSIIIDCRTGGTKNDAALFELDYDVRNILTEILEEKVTLGSIRYRIHNGYPPQDGSSSGGYYSGLVTDASVTIGSNEKKHFKTPPIVVILEESSPLAPIFSGLQSAGKVAVVSEDSSLGVEAYTLSIADGVKVKILNTELIAPDGSAGFFPDFLAGKGLAMKTAERIVADSSFHHEKPKRTGSNLPLVSQKDNTYPEMEFPDQEYRLLALFKFWNVINYFYPYKNLTGNDWGYVLRKYIPEFEGNKDAAAYRLSTGKMVAEIKDSHGFFQPPRLKNPPQVFLPPTVEAYAENQTYIRGVLDESSGFRKGDVVLDVDGIPISTILEKFTVRVAASTPQSLMRQVHGYGIFRGDKDTKAVFRVKGLDGKVRNVNSVRNVAPNDPRFRNFDFSKRKTPVISVLPSGAGYVDLDRLQPDQVDSMFNFIDKLPAVIFDMRGYPNGTAWQIAPRLTEKNRPVAALFDNPLIEAKNVGENDYAEGTSFVFAQRLPERGKGNVYKGKVVMLIDENSQSQSEHTALFFEAARPDITFIGTPTAGANGDVTNLVLPGNIKVSFSGHGVRHADGRQLQRIGIQPTIKVVPTIKGIIAGRDEILEAAEKFLKTK